MRSIATFLPCFLFLAAFAVGQAAIVVDAANGPGTNFVDLPQAVAAAGHGARLIVRPGNYSPFHVDGKALRISGAGPTQTLIDGPAVSGGGGFYVTVSGVPAGSDFRLEGVGIHSAWPTLTNGPYVQLYVWGSAGKVVLSDVVVSPPSSGGAGIGLYVLGAEVHAFRSSFTGGWRVNTILFNGYRYAYGEPGFFGTVGSVLAATDCDFIGGDVALSLAPAENGAAYGGLGVWTLGAGGRISGSRLVGGSGVVVGGMATFAGGGAGLAVQSNAPTRVDGASTISGGTGAVGGAPPSAFSPAVYQSGYYAVVNLHASVVLFAGGGAPTVFGLVNLGLPELPTLTCDGTEFADGALDAAAPATIAMTYTSLPGAPFVLLIAGSPALWSPFPAAMTGEFLLADYSAPVLVGATDAAGAFSFSFTAAASIPAALDVPLHLQAAVYDAAQNKVRMSPATLRVFR